MDNDCLDPSRIDDVKEDIDYYIEVKEKQKIYKI